MDENKKNDSLDSEHYFVIPPDFLSSFSENPLSEFLTVTAIGQFIKAKYHYCPRPEGIDTSQLIYCYDGAGYYLVGNGEGGVVNPGQLVILPPGKPHSYASTDDNPWSIFWIHVKGKYLDSFSSAWPLPEAVHISEIYNKRIRDIFSQCFAILAAPYQWEEFFYLCQLAATFISLIPSAAKQSAKGLTANGLTGVEAAISYMKDHLRITVTLEDLASASGFSPSHLHYLFRPSTGYAPVEYFLRMKIQAAARDIVFSEMPIHRIADAYGIFDPYYFSRLFKKISGLSPAAYRKGSQSLRNKPVPIPDWLVSHTKDMILKDTD